MIAWLENENKGKETVQYKLRDWLFSRQRYWGEPMPIIHYGDEVKSLDESDLPLELPEVEKYEPTGTGKSPLANITDWVEIKNEEGEVIGLRETNTMPQWAGSCWYYLRYIDPKNNENAWDSDKNPIGCLLIYMWAGQSTLFFICSMPVSGTMFYMI